MAGEQETIQSSITLLRKRSLKESFLAYSKLTIGIIIKGVILSCVLYALVTLPWFTFFIPNSTIANYLIVGILIEILISLSLFAKNRDINKIYRYYLSKDFPPIDSKPKIKKSKVTIKSQLSSIIHFIQMHWKGITYVILTDFIVIIWYILNPPDPASLPYNILAIVIYTFFFLWVIVVIPYILEEMKQAPSLKSYLKQERSYFTKTLRSVLPSKKESVALLLVAFVLATPLYFNKDIGMPSFVNSYEHSGYFNSLAPIYADGNNSTKAENIANWSTSHFNDLYTGLFGLTLNPMIIGNIIPPALTIRPDTRNTSLASKYVLIVQNGNCEESALALMGFAEMAGIPVRQVAFHGEDHTFIEMFVDGRWMIIDPLTKYNDNGYDVPPRFYETNWSYKVSYAEATYPNGTIEDVTDRYTDIGTIMVRVVDKDNQIVPNATVSVNSHNRANLPTNLTMTTGPDGTVELTLGDGLYQITATNDTLTGSTSNLVTLNASENKSVTITLNNKNTPNWVIEAMNNSDLVYYIVALFGVIIGTLAIFILLRFYNNRYLKMVFYGFYTIVFLFILLTLLRIFIMF